MRSGFLDFFLVNFSKFTISGNSGFILIPTVLKKTLVAIDYCPIGFMYTFIQDSIQIFKHYYSLEKKRHLYLTELLSSRYNSILRSKKFETEGIKLTNNTPHEIRDCVMEMNSRLDRTWKTSEEDENNQKYFWSLFPNKLRRESNNKVLHGKINAKIGTKFLRQYISKRSVI